MLVFSPPVKASTARLNNLTDEQLVKLHDKIWERIDWSNGGLGWDWPTLSACHPGYARMIASIKLSLRQRRL